MQKRSIELHLLRSVLYIVATLAGIVTVREFGIPHGSPFAVSVFVASIGFLVIGTTIEQSLSPRQAE